MQNLPKYNETPDQNVDLSKISRSDLEAIVGSFIEKGRISPDEVNSELYSMRETTGERVKASIETKVLAPEVLATLKSRFEANMDRHPGIEWEKVQAKLEANPGQAWILGETEKKGGEPDVVGYDKQANEYLFFDCFKGSPEERTTIACDREDQDWLEKNCPDKKCNGNAIDMANAMGIEIPNLPKYTELMEKLYALDPDFGLNSRDYLITPEYLRKINIAYTGIRFDDSVFISQTSTQSQHNVPATIRGIVRV